MAQQHRARQRCIDRQEVIQLGVVDDVINDDRDQGTVSVG